MSKEIYVEDLSKASSIVAAFQAALDEVFSRQTVQQFRGGLTVGQLHQYVHVAQNEPPLGIVTVAFGGRGNPTSIFVTMYARGYHKSPTAIYVLPKLIQNLVVTLPRTGLRGAEFVFDPAAKEYRAHLTVPLTTLQNNQRALIVVPRG